MGVQETLTGAQRAARYRAAKRAQGLRPPFKSFGIHGNGNTSSISLAVACPYI